MQNKIPAHFVLIALGSAGDMYPFLSMAKALQARGHRVSLLGPVVHEHLAIQAGVQFHGMGTAAQYLAALNEPALWNPRKGFAVIWRDMPYGMRQMQAWIADLPLDEHCVILAHPLALAAAALARAHRPELPIVAAYLAPANLRTVHDPLTIGPLRISRWWPLSWRRWLWQQVDSRFIDPVAVPELNAMRQSVGLPAITHLAKHLYSVADLSVTLFPYWFARPQPDWPSPMLAGDFQLYEPAAEASIKQTLAPALSQFLAAGTAPVVFTAGTGQRHAARFFAQALSATQRLGGRAILLSSHREQIPISLPDTVIWQAYAPLRSLLPQVSALVHHGGIGTTAEALRAGVPQLVVAYAHDQFDNGARIEELGVGWMLPAAGLQTGKLVRKLQVLRNSPALQAQCKVVAARFMHRQDADALCGAIESRLTRCVIGL